MDFFENIDALLWRLAAILALVLVVVKFSQKYFKAQ